MRRALAPLPVVPVARASGKRDPRPADLAVDTAGVGHRSAHRLDLVRGGLRAAPLRSRHPDQSACGTSGRAESSTRISTTVPHP
jgi:hypothetical protein